MARIAINGFGRIGRCVLRAAAEDKNIEFVAINDLTDAKTLAHLLKYDSVHGRFKGTVEAREKAIVVNGKEIPILAERDPSKLPWKDLNVDMVLECTGIFRKHAQAQMHIDAGAKFVLISAPSPDPDATFCYGINHEQFDASKHKIVSNASCTTNALAPVCKVLHENLGIEKALMTTIHSYTNDQQLLDLPHKDLRRARAAALSMIPTTTGAAKAVGLVLPELNGKVNGLSIRVPTPNVSLVDLTAEVKKGANIDEINAMFKKAAEGELKGILAYDDEDTVSIDHNGSSFSSIFDAGSTSVVGDNMVKVFAWYDNEMGFSNRMVDMIRFMTK